MVQDKFLNTMTCKKHTLSFILLFTVILIAACASQPRVSIEVLPDYNALFEREDGWTGADGAYTVKLSYNRILWLFGDTWYGGTRGGRHENAILINNSIAIQRGIIPPDVSVNFYTGRAHDGEPRAFVRPSDSRGWFWIYHGIELDKTLYLYLIQAERTADRNSFGFKIIGTWLGRVANPEDSPNRWRVSQHRIPWERLSPAGDTIFGSAVLGENNFIYIYGTTEDVVGGIRHKSMILARVPETKLEQFDQWRFFSAGRWTTDYSKLSRLGGDLANEYSVSYLAALEKYIAVYTAKGLSKNIVARFAPNPWGPWSEPEVLYECPEEKWGSDVFCYAAKGHPELSLAPDEIIVTYVASSLNFEKLASDARLYRPRFLRVRFQD
ncbi:MAG: DUF4185 domain-containing protein [Desulfobacterales bacterium]|nr:MAG: DUF4185 domain-containing protein [Desulfobacterales bacterium]